MGRLARRVADKRLLRIIRRFLEAGSGQQTFDSATDQGVRSVERQSFDKELRQGKLRFRNLELLVRRVLLGLGRVGFGGVVIGRHP